MTNFEFASGTVQGTDHVRAGKNNQDAFYLRQTANHTVAVVCDGCSSGKHSEAGANFGALLVSHVIERQLTICEAAKQLLNWSWIRREVVEELYKWAKSMGAVKADGSVSSTFVNSYLLFTCVAAVITDDYAEFVTVGDGVIIVNGETVPVGTFENNAPPYLAYGLMKTSMPADMLEFKVHKTLLTAELQSFLIGSDGVGSLIAAESKPWPGKAELIGPISKLWTEDRFFKNPDIGRRHLTLINGGLGFRLSGHLEDDTTFISGRRSNA